MYEGESWGYDEFPKYDESDRLSYCRGILVKADNSNVIFVGNEDTMQEMIGDIRLSKDGSKTGGTANLPVELNSRIYWFTNHASILNIIAAASIYGYLYVSDDGGDSWRKVRKEFGEIRTLAIMPN